MVLLEGYLANQLFSLGLRTSFYKHWFEVFIVNRTVARVTSE